jgi:branched-subunit amino acid aminotransferase/4-amino-4-deoxychorismate lyase
MVEIVQEFAPWLGVFETLRVVDGVPLFVPEHVAELNLAMEALGLESDFDFDQASLHLPRESGRWRWLVTPEGTRTFFTPGEELDSEPIALSVSLLRVGANNWDARFKTVSYLSHVQAAKSATTPEVILLNEHGNLASGSRSNLFWMKDGILYTPAHESGCRRGVIRNFVFQCHKVKAGYFPSSDILKADEVFITNSLRGIVSVKQVKGKTWYRFPVAHKLREEYAEAVGVQVRAGRKRRGSLLGEV